MSPAGVERVLADPIVVSQVLTRPERETEEVLSMV